VKQSLELDKEYKATIEKEIGGEFLNSLSEGNVLEAQQGVEREKMQSLIRIITTLQAENIQVLEAKAELLDQSEIVSQGSVQ